jgi:hypothetical protein
MSAFDFGDCPVDELVDFDGETLGYCVHCPMDLGETVEGEDYGFDVGERVTFGVNGGCGDYFVE